MAKVTMQNNSVSHTRLKFADATHKTVHDTNLGLQKLSTCKAVCFTAVHPEVPMLVTLGLTLGMRHAFSVHCQAGLHVHASHCLISAGVHLSTCV